MFELGTHLIKIATSVAGIISPAYNLIKIRLNFAFFIIYVRINYIILRATFQSSKVVPL